MTGASDFQFKLFPKFRTVLQPKGLNIALLCVKLAGGFYRISDE
jgi:hypothetical protein